MKKNNIILLLLILVSIFSYIFFNSSGSSNISGKDLTAKDIYGVWKAVSIEFDSKVFEEDREYYNNYINDETMEAWHDDSNDRSLFRYSIEDGILRQFQYLGDKRELSAMKAFIRNDLLCLQLMKKDTTMCFKRIK